MRPYLTTRVQTSATCVSLQVTSDRPGGGEVSETRQEAAGQEEAGEHSAI